MRYTDGLKKLTTLTGWQQFLIILNAKEKMVFFSLILLVLSSSILLFSSFYCKNTEIVPSEGGEYIEGVVGSPRFINPVYAASSDVDRDLTELIYSGLMKYDENGKIVPDLTEEYKVLEDGKIYEFTLKENLLWQDEKPLNADDVVFTIKTIQNPSLKSPVRANWLGVKVEKISDLSVRFELSNPSAVFLENCTLKILPAHVWQDITSQNFPLSIYNLKPVGSGPYKLKTLAQDNQGNIKSLELVANQNYAGKKPNIPKITFFFFEKEDDEISAFNSKQINGFSPLSPQKEQNLKNQDFSEYLLSLPRYFAVFFNPEKSKVLAEKNVRQALNYGTNKEEIVDKILFKQGRVVDSPILPDIYGFEKPEKTYEFNQTTARQLLDAAGFVENVTGIGEEDKSSSSPFTDAWVREKIVKKEPAFQFKSNLKLGSQRTEVKELQKCLAKDPEIYPEGEVTGYFGNKTKEAVVKFQEKYKEEILQPSGLQSGTGEVLKSTQKKLNELCAAPSEEKLPLSFTLTTVNQPVLVNVASLLKEQWKSVGINVEIKAVDILTLGQEVIRTRDYEMFLFGEVLNAVPDLFPFWHSSQIKDPGLNLAGYENKECDKLLEEARQSLNEEERREKLVKFQDLLIEDAPAVFLYSPDYLYLISKEIKGVEAGMIVDPSKRFSGIENWYIKTKRVWQ